jgi:hypothetical protein
MKKYYVAKGIFISVNSILNIYHINWTIVVYIIFIYFISNQIIESLLFKIASRGTNKKFDACEYKKI